jgi:Xaa-Pro dipeptidase
MVKNMEEKYQEKLLSLMRKQGIDAMMIAPSEEMRFLAGFHVYQDERFQALFLTARGDCFYICNLLSRDEVAAGSRQPMPIYTWTDNQLFVDVVGQVMEQYGLAGGTIGVNSTVRACHLIPIEQKTGARFVDGKPWLEEIRIIKNSQEMENLRIASQIADDIFPKILEFIRPGLREIDVRTEMERLFTRQGVRLAGDIVASGPNSALPHYFGNQRIIQKQDVVILDYGCCYKGMFSDVTRTVFVGGITPEQEKVYDIVRRANRAARKMVAEGAYIPDIDQAARQLIAEEGYGEYFITRLGHGIGYITHEQPEIKASNPRRLEKGMAFSIEPGIYMAGKFGIRIEDIMMIGESGPEQLNKTTHEPVVL